MRVRSVLASRLSSRTNGRSFDFPSVLRASLLLALSAAAWAVLVGQRAAGGGKLNSPRSGAESTQPCRLAHKVVKCAPSLKPAAPTFWLGTETGIVKRELTRRRNDGVRTCPRSSVELVDVRTRLVEIETAALSSAIGEDDNVPTPLAPAR
jgi:hypothetical protein